MRSSSSRFKLILSALLLFAISGSSIPLYSTSSHGTHQSHMQSYGKESSIAKNYSFLRLSATLSPTSENSVKQPLPRSLFDQPKFHLLQHIPQNIQEQPPISSQSSSHVTAKALTASNASESDGSTRSKNPFSVTIDRAKFYGGLVSYSHHLHPAKICRVFNACVRPDHTLVLPKWMQRHDDIITFHCGYSKVEFSLPDTEPPPPLDPLDMVGLHVSRPSMPDFLRDFMPNAVVFDLIYGDHRVSKACHSRKGDDCAPFPGLVEGIRTAVTLHRRLRHFDEKKSWVREFVKLMKPPQTGRQPVILYDKRFSAHVNSNSSRLKCFRSAMFTRGPFNKHAIMADHIRDIHFLNRNAINKKPRDVLLPDAVPNQPERRQCHLNITISNRKLVDGAHNRLIGRYLVNVAILKDAILKQATRIPGLNLTVATMTLEGRSLRWQINAMQKTDIWVAGHGPLLANMIFLRENSTLMEVQPFTFYPQTFEHMASRLAYVRYDRYIAHPDVEAFEMCMRQLYPPMHPAHRHAQHILSRFVQAAGKYSQSDNTHSLVLHRDAAEFADLHHVKTCAQMQRLDTDADKISKAIVRQARLMCGYPRPDVSGA